MEKNISSEQLVKLIKERRTVHNFKSEKIEQNVLQQAVELMIYAPNHKNTQPWKIFRLHDSARKQVAELAVELKSAKDANLTDAMKKSTYEKFLSCPELLVLTIKKSGDANQQKEDYASLACAVQNASLYLWSEGVGSKWSTGAVTKHPRLYKILNVSEQELDLEGFLWVGLASGSQAIPPKATLEKIYKEVK